MPESLLHAVFCSLRSPPASKNTMLAAELFVIALFTPTQHLFTANFYFQPIYQCACTSVHNGPHLGSLVPRPTPAGPWGTAGPVPSRLVPS